MDWIGRISDWLFAIPAKAWGATAALSTAGIALGTVLVAGTYAKTSF